MTVTRFDLENQVIARRTAAALERIADAMEKRVDDDHCLERLMPKTLERQDALDAGELRATWLELPEGWEAQNDGVDVEITGPGVAIEAVKNEDGTFAIVVQDDKAEHVGQDPDWVETLVVGRAEAGSALKVLQNVINARVVNLT